MKPLVTYQLRCSVGGIRPTQSVDSVYDGLVSVGRPNRGVVSLEIVDGKLAIEVSASLPGNGQHRHRRNASVVLGPFSTERLFRVLPKVSFSSRHYFRENLKTSDSEKTVP